MRLFLSLGLFQGTERGGGNGGVVERDTNATSGLRFLVAFAGKDDHIAALRAAQDVRDGFGAVEYDFGTAAGFAHALQGFARDGVGIFAARVIASDNDDVRSERGGAAHLRPLAAVAVAAAAEQGEDARGAGEFAGESEDVGERVVRMRIVDEDGEVECVGNGFEAAGDRREFGRGGDDAVEIEATGECGRNGRDQVVNVDAADEARLDYGASPNGLCRAKRVPSAVSCRLVAKKSAVGSCRL